MKAEIVSNQNSESINNSSNLKYCKLICNQDLNRTPSIGRNVAENFFNLNLDHGESKTLLFSFKDQNFEVEINKRKTRNEYRFFLNRIKNEISYDVDDILEFTKKEGGFYLDIIKNGEKKYSSISSKMYGKFHAIE